MCNQDRYSIIRPLAASALLYFGAIVPAVQAAEGIAQPGTETLLILAATEGMERRQYRREDRRDDRQDRRETRRDCAGTKKAWSAKISGTASRMGVRSAVRTTRARTEFARAAPILVRTKPVERPPIIFLDSDVGPADRFAIYFPP